jgi:ribosomal protein L12E/L44/L45/RPP1/RPP2
MDEAMKSKLPASIAAAEKAQIEKDARKSRGDIKEEEVKENLNEVKRMQKLAGIIK